MGKIASIYSYESYGQDGEKTLTVWLELDNGIKTWASIAKNRHRYPYQFKGVDSRASEFVNKVIGPKLIGVSPLKQFEVDGWLVNADSTSNREKLGIETITAISVLFAKAAAALSNVSPYLYLKDLYNLRFGGSPISLEKMPSAIVPIIKKNADTKDFDFKEFLLTPSTSIGFAQGFEMIMRYLREINSSYKTAMISGNLDILQLIIRTFESLNLKYGKEIFLGVDFDANSFGRSGSYSIKDKSQPVQKSDYLSFVVSLAKKYSPLFLIDPVTYDDLALWKSVLAEIPKNTYLVGQSLIASNPERLKKIVKENICSSFVIRQEEAGTISEVFEMVNLARQNNLNYIFSHSEKETNDTFLADLAVALQADFVRLGFPLFGEGFGKYNRMLEIESEMLKKKK